jgi:hypothetical protein
MEPERKIEKLLRACAKKRRADAGDSFKLHPATRRLLQGEIARNAAKPDEEDSLSLWELFRRQWAVLAGFAIIVFFGAALFLPALSSAKKKAQNVSAMNNLKQIGAAAQMAAEENNGKLPASLDALTNQLGSDKSLTDSESGKRFIYIAGGENLDGLPSNSVLAYSPADKKGRAVLFADGRVEVVKDSQFSELTNRELLQLALKDSSRREPGETPATTTIASGNAAAIPPISGKLKSEANRNDSKPADAGIAAGNIELAANVPAPAVDRRIASPSAINNFAATQADSFQFASAASHNLTFGLQNSFKNTVKPVQVPPVLSNFQVQQNGSAIRVVDADGSVYNGSLQPEISVAQNAMPSRTPAAPSAAPVQVQQQKEITRRDESQSAQNYSFRVSGLNQTLQQNVVFTGSLLAISNVASLPQLFSGSSSIGGGGGQSQSMLTNQLPWSNSRIAGSAVIADTNNIEINAVPLPP